MSESCKLEELIQDVATSVELPFELSMEQVESIVHFARGKDVFVSLPTGSGKSMCYILLRVFDKMRGVENKSIVLVISPLVAIMQEQVETVQALGISAVYVSDIDGTREKHLIKRGQYQVVYISPEALFCSTEWKEMLSTEYYRENLVAMVIDEAHCIRKWYG